MPRPLAPSGVSVLIEPDDEAPLVTGSPVLGDKRAAIHPLRSAAALSSTHYCSSFPTLTPNNGLRRRERYLSRAAFDWKPEEIENALRSVLGVIDDPLFAPVCAQVRWRKWRSWEHCICGQGARCFGCDRPAGGEWTASADRGLQDKPSPPTSARRGAGAYVAQLALYRQLLEPLYPGKTVEAALLFTEGPYLIDIPVNAMRDARRMV